LLHVSTVKIPLAHRFECRHLLDVVRVEVLQLKAILEKDPPV
jgi:hypothetical protein